MKINLRYSLKALENGCLRRICSISCGGSRGKNLSIFLISGVKFILFKNYFPLYLFAFFILFSPKKQLLIIDFLYSFFFSH